MDADVIIFDRNSDRLKYLKDYFKGEVETSLADSPSIEAAVIEADLVIGAVLIPGTKAPKLVSNATVAKMKPGSVLVDISIDQGGCFEDSKPTTHTDPTYKVHNSIFYCVANMPGAVPHTSTYALTNATLPYISSIANNGWREALTRDSGFKPGLNVHKGAVVYKPVADALNMPYVDAWAI
jgi:alanine dehydrogenase